MRPRKPMNRNFQGQGGGRGPMQRRPFRQGGGQQGGGFDKQARARAAQNREKYLAKARDALAAGDRVEAENWFQHAEHYYRVVVSLTPPEQLNPQPEPYQEGGESLDAPPFEEGAQPQQHQDFDGSQAQAQPPQQPRPASPDSPVMEHGGYDRPVFDRPGYQPRQQRRRYPNQDGQAQPQEGQPREPRPRPQNRFESGQNLPPFLAEEPTRPERKPAAEAPAPAPREEGEQN
ncbi:MAG: DUF4167 domain-containing protein [Alphaproteobacteria bacterium]|nr:DUF4167 domain-containing protein [Alphaproteobacteria bacterium]